MIRIVLRPPEPVWSPQGLRLSREGQLQVQFSEKVDPGLAVDIY
jgi:hypothetical protein